MRAITYALLLLAALVAACATIPLGHAADLPDRSKIAAPWTPFAEPAEVAWKAHNWYIGGMVGHQWAADGQETDADNSWPGAIVGGYLWRSGPTGFAAGVEVDYAVRDLGRIRDDDGVLSVRGRAGAFMTPTVFLYGTAGVAEASELAVPDGLRRGLVVGGGIELDATKNIAVRAEVLHYRHDDDRFGWGEDGSTAGRLGLLFKF